MEEKDYCYKMEEIYCYAEKFSTRQSYYYKLIIIKETKAQIIAHMSANSMSVFKFSKKTNMEISKIKENKLVLITFQEYKEKINNRINQEIKMLEEKISAMKEECKVLQTKLIK